MIRGRPSGRGVGRLLAFPMPKTKACQGRRAGQNNAWHVCAHLHSASAGHCSIAQVHPAPATQLQLNHPRAPGESLGFINNFLNEFQDLLESRPLPSTSWEDCSEESGSDPEGPDRSIFRNRAPKVRILCTVC